MTEAFRGWVEHHPGDLAAGQVTWYLGAVHDLLAPDCAIPATTDLRADRRLRPVESPAVREISAAFAELDVREEAYRHAFPNGRLGPPRDRGAQ
jgi:hypothetical protein